MEIDRATCKIVILVSFEITQYQLMLAVPERVADVFCPWPIPGLVSIEQMPRKNIDVFAQMVEVENLLGIRVSVKKPSP